MKRFDILCKDGRCLICESKMFWKYSNYACTNGCYRIFNDKFYRHIYIFNEIIDVIDIKYHPFVKYLIKRNVKKNIKYWKKNDRYVMKILEEN